MLENKAFLLNGPGNTTNASVGNDDVLVEVKKTGICGSDMHFYIDGRIINNIISQSFAPGHESSGVIVKAGAGVENVKVGDRVALEPAARCRVCVDCKGGKYQTPADFVYKLPEHLTLEDGATMEFLFVAVHAISAQGKVQLGENVVVFGAGPIRLPCMAVARAIGAARIIAVDIKLSRLQFAHDYAATGTFLSPAMQAGESKFEYATRTAEIMKETLGIDDRGPNGFDVVFDATGAETCVQMGILLAKFGGVGVGTSTVTIPMSAVLERELTIKGAVTYGLGDYPLAIRLVSSGKVDLKPLVTRRCKFEDSPTAFETVRDGKGPKETGQTKDAIKVIISGPDVDVASI